MRAGWKGIFNSCLARLLQDFWRNNSGCKTYLKASKWIRLLEMPRSPSPVWHKIERCVRLLTLLTQVSRGFKSHPRRLNFFKQIIIMDWRLLSLIPLPVLIWVWIELIRNEAPPVPLPRNTIRRMLRLAELKRNENFYDLGSGDGRGLVIASKEFHARAVGIEKNRLMVFLSRLFIKRNRLNARIIHGDLFKQDIGNANVILIYLSHKLTQKLKTKFKAELRKGTRIVSASHHIAGWKEIKKMKTGHFYSYLYKI